MTKRKFNIQPLLIILVFVGPIVLAVVAYYGSRGWVPRALHGQLIEPPIALPPVVFATSVRDGATTERLGNRWSFIYARIAPCGEECLAHLHRLTQVRQALPEDRRDRVQMLLMFAGPRPSLPAMAGWTASPLDDAAGRAIIELLGEQNIRDGRVYIADPLGNLVISYPPDAAQKGMLEDLKRLLMLSPTGMNVIAAWSKANELRPGRTVDTRGNGECPHFVTRRLRRPPAAAAVPGRGCSRPGSIAGR